jgi:hypothetical protein
LLLDDFSGRREELHLFMVQFMAVFFAVNNEIEASVTARHCNKFYYEKSQVMKVVLKQYGTCP